MEAWLEKDIFNGDFPFKLFFNEGRFSMGHHWHEEIEIIYMIEGSVKVGVNNEIYNLAEGDILLISSRDIHYFLPEYNLSNRAVIQFDLSIFDNFAFVNRGRKEIRPIFHHSKRCSREWENDVKFEMEQHIKGMIEEYNKKEVGYEFAINARIYDLTTLILRKVPMGTPSLDEETKQMRVLDRLENIFQYVENNYASMISLEDIAREAGFSPYHFTRFFKNNTGMTFGQYLSNFRITKAEWLLVNTDYSVTEIAYRCGFSNIKGFNRVFKSIKGQSPSQYKKSNK